MLQQEGYRQIKFHQLLALKLCSLPPEVNQVSLNFHKEGEGQMQKTSKKNSNKTFTQIEYCCCSYPPHCSLHHDAITVRKSRLGAA